jgi:hypothetical protein
VLQVLELLPAAVADQAHELYQQPVRAADQQLLQ